MIEDEALSLLKRGFKQWLTVKLSSPWRAIQLPNPSGQDDVLWTAVPCSEAPLPSLRLLSAVRLQPEQQTLVSSQLPLRVTSQIRSGCHRFVVPVPLQPGLAAAFSSVSHPKPSEALKSV